MVGAARHGGGGERRRRIETEKAVLNFLYIFNLS
jgi:hypothetical protein